jgi:hypothetical protein
MSFLLLNLFAAPTVTDGAVAGRQAGSAPFGDVLAAGAAPVSEEKFAAYLQDAKQGLQPKNAALSNAAQAGAISGAAQFARLGEAAIAADPLLLSDTQAGLLKQALQDALNANVFSGEGSAKQAFKELQEQLDLGELAEDAVDIDAVLLDLPSIEKLPQAPKDELLSKIRQFIHASLGGNNQAQKAQVKAGDLADTANKAQQQNTAKPLSEPLLEAVQASLFLTGKTAQTQVSAQNANTETTAQIASTQETLESELPRWVRDIGILAADDAAATSQDSRAQITLPEVSLPGADEVNIAQNNGLAVSVLPSENTLSRDALAKQDASQLTLNKAQTGAETQLVSSDKKQVNAVIQTASFADNLKADTSANATMSRELLSPLPGDAKAASASVISTQAGVDNAVILAQPAQAQAATYDAQARIDPQLYQHRGAVLEQVHIAITRAKNLESDRITVQLDPADLGRVEVVMDVKQDGRTHLHILAERRETLDMLQRDARGLERALQEAGLKTDAGGMEFSMQQQANPHAANDNGHEQGANQHQAGGEHVSAAQAEHAKNAADAANMADAALITSASYVIENGLDVTV